MEPNHTIMVMDHDTSISMLMEEILLSEGYSVRRCNGSQFTIGAIEQINPDAIIADTGHAGADTALMLVQQVRRHPSLRGIGVLLTSTDNRLLDDIRPQLRQLHCNAVAKPFDLSEFLRQVQQSLISVGQEAPCA